MAWQTSTTMKMGVFVAVLICALPSAGAAQILAPQAEPGSSQTDTKIETAVDEVAQKALLDKEAPGLAIAVSRNGRLQFVRAYGSADLENDVAVTPNTVFEIGSITKEFTATAILLLAERGKLELDDSIEAYFPKFPRSNEVTIRQLLNHTSGIRNFTNSPGFLETIAVKENSSEEMLSFIVGDGDAFDFDPGTAFSYSNSGYYMLGLIVEEVSGSSYETFLAQNILIPQNFDDLKVEDLTEILPHRSEGYDKDEASVFGFKNANYISMSAAGAAGAMRSTAGDLARWHDLLLAGKILDANSLNLMLTPGRLADGTLPSKQDGAPASPGVGYGFGIIMGDFGGHRTIGHGGGIFGFNANVTSFPDQNVTIVLLTNSSTGTLNIKAPLYEAILANMSAPTER